MRKIIQVNKCSNQDCKFYASGECLTKPEVLFENATCECLSNTDDWMYLIPASAINKEEEENETFR